MQRNPIEELYKEIIKGEAIWTSPFKNGKLEMIKIDYATGESRSYKGWIEILFYKYIQDI